MPPVDTSDHPPMPEQGGELLSDVLNRLDAARDGFFAATTRYATLPTDTYGERVVESTELVADAMRNSAMFVLRDDSAEAQQKASIIATLIEDDDRLRVAHFGDLTSDKVKFREAAIERQTVIDRITHDLQAGASWDVVLGQLMGAYCHSVNIDLEKFMGHVPTSRNARMLRLGMTVGKQVLDVAKTTAGVAAGIALARHMARRLNT